MKKIIQPLLMLLAMALLPSLLHAFTITGPTSGNMGFTGTYTIPFAPSCNTTFTVIGGTIVSPTACAGGTTCVTSGNSITIKWNCTSSGTHRVDASRSGSGLCTGTGTLNVTVNMVTMTPGTITGPSPACPGVNSTYSIAAVANANGYLWELPLGGGTIVSGQNTTALVVNWTTSGSRTVRVTPQHNGCNGGSNSVKSVTVSALVGSSGTLTGPSPVCQGSAGHVYTIPAVTNATGYTWTLPPGGTITAGSNTSSITVSYGTSASSGNVTVTPFNSCGSGTMRTLAVTVNNLPSTPGPITGPNSICIGGGNAPYSIAAVAGATGYTWSASGGTLVSGAGTTAVVVNWTTAGARTLTVTPTNACGNGVAANLTVRVYATPPAHNDSLSFAHAQLSSAIVQSLIIDHCQNNHPCAPQPLVSSKVYFKLSTGDDYEYGTSTFNVNVTLNLTARDAYSGGTAVQTGTQSLTLNASAPEQWYVWDISANYAAIHRVDMQFTGYSATALVQPTLKLKVYNETEFLTAAAGQTVTLNAVNTAPSGTNKLTFSWSTSCGSFPNYEFQLLRLFNTDVDKAETGVATNVTVDVDWSKALTILTQGSATSLQLAMAEGTGYYVWRVRPIGTQHAGGAGNDLNWGNWSGSGAFTQGATVNLTTGVSPHCFFYNQSEASRNWMYARFHSDGDKEHPGVKMKETMIYANGISQPKQTQTLLESGGDLLVSQQFYDYNGRNSIGVQGVPVLQNYFTYIPQLVQSTAGNLYTAASFDGPTTALNPQAITAGHVASYWSSTNPDPSIPDAQGYPFARTYYYGDGTGRVLSSNIPGAIHRYGGSIMGNDKATRVFYAGVSEAEVLSIFGDEAPKSTEMRKIITLDPDGVAQVAYLNSLGQTIATCLSASSGSSLTELDEPHNVLSIQDFIEGGTLMEDGSLVTSKPVAFTSPTNLKVYYTLTPKSIEATCGNFCASCDYKLYFTLHNLSDPSASGFPKKDSLIVPGGNCPGTTTGITPFIQYLNLPPGSYRVEKHLYTGTVNPSTGRSYADEAADEFRANLLYEVQSILENLSFYQTSADLAGLNTYLSTDPELTLDPSGTHYTYAGSCFEVQIPKESCDVPNCGTLNFEQMLTLRWGGDPELAKGTLITNYFPASYAVATSNFNSLVANMLADPEYDYTCQQLFDCWSTVVEGYKASYLAYQAIGREYDPLDAFLDCTGRYLERESSTRMTGSYTSPGWFSHAYLALNSASTLSSCVTAVNDASADLGLMRTYPYADTAHWHWQQLLDCNSSFEPDSVWTPSQLADELELNCNSLCQARYPGFVEALLAEYRNDGRYVIAGEGTPGPGQVTITLEQIHCSAQQLVDECEAGCNLTLVISSTPFPHVSSVGTPAEMQAMQESMTYSYDLALPPTGGSCDAGYTTLGGSENQAALLASHLNTALESFRDQMGPGTVQMNLYTLVQNFDATLLTSTTCFNTSTTVTVSSTQHSYFYEKSCSLHYVTPTGSDVVLCSGLCSTETCPTVCFQWISPAVNHVDTSLVTVVQSLSCEAQAVNYVVATVQAQIGDLLDEAAAAYKEMYLAQCADPGSSESYRIEYGLDYHHYTLSYYDRAGHNIRTVPPAGVTFLDPALPTVQNRQVHPAHTLFTEMEYNSLGQVIRTQAPDQGQKTITYNKVGQLRFTQTEQQLAVNAYSYVKYDALGRPIDEGQSTASAAGGSFKNFPHVQNFPLTGTERTLMTYSTPSGASYSASKPQRFTQDMVTHAYTDEDGNLATTTDQVHTHFSYTPQRYMEWVIQDLPELGQNTILYDIDPGDGQLRRVIYNEGRVDQFLHRYAYDADNRMVKTETSTDGVIWERDQRLEYFRHGNAKRVTLGEDLVQGIDYTYTLNGTLKAINHPSLLGADDPGADGITGSHSKVARDAFGMMLNYFREDFRHGSNSLTADVSNPWYASSQEYFNGKVSSWVNNTQAVGGLQLEQATAWQYQYDKAGRLLEALLHKQVSGYFASIQDYRCNYIYDANGNLLQTARNGYSALSLIMDGIDYHYLPGTNKLGHVTDVTFTSAYNNDIESQNPGNYSYDAAGRLIGDVSGKRTITWNHADKVRNIFLDETGTANDANLSMMYDAGGHRTVKKNIRTNGTHVKTLFYVNDASGQNMAVYEKEIVGDSTFFTRIEAPIYAGGRIGQHGKAVVVKKVKGATVVIPTLPAANGKYTRQVGDRQYEMRDHLTNVRATVTDTKQPVNVNNLSLGFTAQIGMVANYDPFGAEMPGRMYSADNYRIGFNGQEKDEEVYGNGNSYTAEYWQYDSRLGRRWNCDPVVNPSESPYAAFRNCPVSYTDVRGDHPQCDELNQTCNEPQGIDVVKAVKWLFKGRKDDSQSPSTPSQNESSEDYSFTPMEEPADRSEEPEYEIGWSTPIPDYIPIPEPPRFDGVFMMATGLNSKDHSEELMFNLFPPGVVEAPLGKSLLWYPGVGGLIAASVSACLLDDNNNLLRSDEMGSIFVVFRTPNISQWSTYRSFPGEQFPLEFLISCPDFMPRPVPVPVPIPIGNPVNVPTGVPSPVPFSNAPKQVPHGFGGEVPVLITGIGIYKAAESVFGFIGTIGETAIGVGARITAPFIITTEEMLQPPRPDPPGTMY